MGAKKALDNLYKRINDLCPNKDGSDNENVKYLKSLFDGMSEKEVVAFAKKMQEDGTTIPYIAPNFDENNECKMEDIFKVGEKLGYKSHQNVWVTEPDGTSYQTPVKQMIGMLMVRRQNQTAMHSQGFADSGNTINIATGQVTGNSKVSRISFPEFALIAQYPGTLPVLQEFAQFRGGDVKARRYLKMSIANTGQVDHAKIDELDSRARIVDTLNMYLLGASLNSTIAKKATDK